MIAAVNGPAVGWGMDLTLFCDIRIASERARFGELFIKRGLVSDIGGLQRLPQIVGPSKAAELLFTGDVIDAKEAERIGLVSQVVPHEALLPTARAMAAKIAANPPLALRYMKEGLRRSRLSDAHELGAWVSQTLGDPVPDRGPQGRRAVVPREARAGVQGSVARGPRRRCASPRRFARRR